MNRLLLIPCLASCLGFAILASSAPVDPVGHRSIKSRDHGANPSENLEPLLSAEKLREDLADRWKRTNDSKRTFSRVYRPERYRQRINIAIDESLPAPEGSFAGICLLEIDQPTLGLESREAPSFAASSDSTSAASFPFVVDRRSGDAIVFAAGKWTDFSQWAATGN